MTVFRKCVLAVPSNVLTLMGKFEGLRYKCQKIFVSAYVTFQSEICSEVSKCDVLFLLLPVNVQIYLTLF